MSAIYIEKRALNGIWGLYYDHMYLVYKDDNGNEFIIRGGPSNPGSPYGDISIQANVEISVSAEARGADTPEDRYQTELDLGGRDAEDVWNIMLQHAADIQSANIEYIPAFDGQNSNSVIASILNVIGLEPLENMPTGTSGSEVPGVINFLAFDYSLTGTAGDDIIQGFTGSDSISGGDGVDHLVGGAGNDYLSGGANGDIIYGDGMYGSTGSDGNDTISGGAGDDTIFGGGGNDIFAIEAGNDTMVGGSGLDIYNLPTGEPGAGGDIGLDTIEEMSGANGFILRIGPNDLLNSAYGITLTNTDGGTDYILGGGVVSSGFAPVYKISVSGSDLTIYETVRLSSLGWTPIPGTGWNPSADKITISGGAANPSDYGLNLQSNMSGTSGADTMTGSNYNDTISGGGGSDTIDGRNGIDTVSYGASLAGGVNINLGTNTHSGGDAAGDSITNIENIDGTYYSDVLVGNALSNVIWGNHGYDSITGGGGADTLYGGFHADTFIFPSASDSTDSAQDIIMDYNHGDRISVVGLGYSHVTDFSVSQSGGYTEFNDPNSDFSFKMLGNLTLADGDFMFT